MDVVVVAHLFEKWNFNFAATATLTNLTRYLNTFEFSAFFAFQSTDDSSSVLLISPENYILLLRRVQTSSSFASAHVFPGGNISPFHDGDPPAPEDASRHHDSEVYRMAAVRETFEESGILLARTKDGRLLEVDEEERVKVRKLVHGDKIKFEDWLEEKDAKADLGKLLSKYLVAASKQS
jgi:8-oxo-dGTP pyrophosphatase MutT (NUDIX family)